MLKRPSMEPQVPMEMPLSKGLLYNGFELLMMPRCEILPVPSARRSSSLRGQKRSRIGSGRMLCELDHEFITRVAMQK